VNSSKTKARAPGVYRSKKRMNKWLMLLSVDLLSFLLMGNVRAQNGVVTPRNFTAETAQGIDEKRKRTFAQQKIDSQLLNAARLKRKGLPTNEADLATDGIGRVAVEISAEVTDNLLTIIRREGGEVVSSYTQFKTVRAYLTLESLETIAGLSEVRVISRAAKAELSVTNPTKEAPLQSQQTSLKVKQPTSMGKVPQRQKRRKKRRQYIR
jgi:hypothetical protein